MLRVCVRLSLPLHRADFGQQGTLEGNEAGRLPRAWQLEARMGNLPTSHHRAVVRSRLGSPPPRTVRVLTWLALAHIVLAQARPEALPGLELEAEARTEWAYAVLDVDLRTGIVSSGRKQTRYVRA